MLGHADISTTMNIYVHATREAKRSLARLPDKVVGGGGSGRPAHAYGPRCPHLGCALKYNPQEHSWDCPCHGSRFGEDGQLIDNPSTDDLRRANR